MIRNRQPHMDVFLHEAAGWI